MSPLITEEVLRKVAQLARLGLQPEEIATMTTEIEKIIRYVEQLKELKLSDIQPMTHAVDITLQLRADKICQFPNATKQLPYQKHNYFYVPVILE